MKKQLLSILLCLIMVVGLLPTAALAEEAAPAFNLATDLADITIPNDLVTCVCTKANETKRYGQLTDGFSATEVAKEGNVWTVLIHVKSDVYMAQFNKDTGSTHSPDMHHFNNDFNPPIQFKLKYEGTKWVLDGEMPKDKTLHFTCNGGHVYTDAYYYEAVKWAQKKGITGGIGNDLFGPNQPCTRAQIATFLWRAAGSPEPKNMSSFSDVPADSYYAKAVAWAVENGITTGTGDGKFSPNAPCTRAQSVTFLWRAAGSPEPKNMSSFSDVPTDSYYAKAVAWAVENGITTGTGDGKFSPNAPCTRAQSVTFLYRTSGSPAVSDSAVFADVEANAFYADAVAWAVANGVTNGTTSSTFSPDNGCTRAQIVTFLYRAFNK